MLSKELTPPATKSKNEFGLLAVITGLVVGWYSGIYLILLSLSTITIYWVAKKLLSADARVYLSAISFQFGQILMLLIFGVLIQLVSNMPFRLDIVLVLDVAVPTIGLIWLITKPGLKPIIFLAAFQICGLVINGINFSTMTVGSLSHKALATHILWRLVALFLMWQAYVAAKKTSGDLSKIET